MMPYILGWSEDDGEIVSSGVHILMFKAGIYENLMRIVLIR